MSDELRARTERNMERFGIPKGFAEAPVEPIWRQVWRLLNDEFEPGDDTYKGVAKDIHNLFVAREREALDEIGRLREQLAQASLMILSLREELAEGAET